MTVKELKEAIENLPDDGIVYIERIHDMYFDKHGWKSITHTDGFQTPHEYTKAFCGYTHDNLNLFIDAHY